jgi:hypothetical protein
MVGLVSRALTGELEPKKGSRGGHKALRIARRKAYYGAQPARTIANKKRTLARQLRRFPEDLQASAVYEKRYGKGALEAPNVALTRKALRRYQASAKAKRSKVRA